MDYFLHVATAGGGTVPVLPDDVRRLIWRHTYPRAVLWCSVCAAAVVVRTHDGRFVHTDSYPTMWIDTPRCAGCTSYPHVHL